MAKTNDPDHLYEEPLRVIIQGPAVVVIGPDAVAVAMTAQAAERSAEILREAAAAARAHIGASPRPPCPSIRSDARR